MPQHAYRIPRVTDAQIHDALNKLGQQHGSLEAHPNILGNGLGVVAFPHPNVPYWQAAVKANSELVNTFYFSLKGVSCNYYRGGRPNNNGEQRPSATLDELVLDTNGVDEQRIEVAQAILELFLPVPLLAPAEDGSPYQEALALQSSNVGRLQNLQEVLVARTIELNTQLDTQVKLRKEELDKQFAEQQEQAAAELAEKQAALDARSSALDQRAKQLDDSDNTSARRKIRSDLLDEVTKRVTNFGVSQKTSAARHPVALGMLALILVFIVTLTWTFREASEHRTLLSQAHSATTNPPVVSASPPAPGASSAKVETAATGSWDAEGVLLAIRVLVLTGGLVASILYYIRWEARWAAQFASDESALKQFHLDVNRANWVVETCLEWQKEAKSPLPESLIDSLTRGLFTTNAPPPQALHPADELASALMGSASKVSLAVGDNRVDFDKPGKIPATVNPAKAG